MAPAELLERLQVQPCFHLFSHKHSFLQNRFQTPGYVAYREFSDVCECTLFLLSDTGSELKWSGSKNHTRTDGHHPYCFLTYKEVWENT